LAKFFASLKETSENGTKNLGKARNQGALVEGKSKSDVEGESLKLLKESGAIFSLRT
jgi:hypothetical protein